jgi:hypothetical protein
MGIQPVSTSQVTSFLSRPTGRDRINIGVLAYMRERNRGHIYNLILDEFERSGISQAILASRLGTAPEIISRRLGAPGNLTQDTISDLLYAISGSEPEYSVHSPHDAPAQNYHASWLHDNTIIQTPERQAVLRITKHLPQIVQEQATPKMLATMGS